MTDPVVVVLGIPVPSTSKLFLGVVAVHVLIGLGAVVSGLVAMISVKGSGRHVLAGTVYYWCLALVFGSMAILSVMRWPEDNHLLMLGMLSFAAGAVGRAARRGQWRHWLQVHVGGMGVSYIVLLTAFYVDNGPHLPFWRQLPAIAYWIVPGLVGLPIIVYTLLRHPLVKRSGLPMFR